MELISVQICHQQIKLMWTENLFINNKISNKIIDKLKNLKVLIETEQYKWVIIVPTINLLIVQMIAIWVDKIQKKA